MVPATLERMTDKRPWTVALTGGIASGKTAVSDAFAQRGVAVVDTDTIAHQLVAPGQPALDKIRQRFGDQVIDERGRLRRAQLRAIIFEDDRARTDLESILHPRIAAEVERRLAASTGPYVLLVVPLLVETGLFSDCDRVLVVDVPERVQIERLMKRDGSSRSQAEAALAAQISRDKRLARADDVVVNTGSLTDLRAEVERLDDRYRRLASGAE